MMMINDGGKTLWVECSPVPITYRSSQGVKTGSEPASLLDRKISTATTFNAEIMNVAVDTDE